jgi:hypothetical protein
MASKSKMISIEGFCQRSETPSLPFLGTAKKPGRVDEEIEHSLEPVDGTGVAQLTN